MELLTFPPFCDFRDLLEQSDHLIRQSEQVRSESMQLSRHLADLDAGSRHLIDHCRRLNERSPRRHRRPADPE